MMARPMRLLVADIIRRKPKGLIVFAAALLPMWWWGVTEAPGRVFAMSMGFAFLLGPQTGLLFLPRATWYLPVTRRDIWRANWLVATAGVTVLTTLIKLTVLLVPSLRKAVGLPDVLLSSLYDLSYCGLGCAFAIAIHHPQPSRGPWRGIWPLVKGTADMALP